MASLVASYPGPEEPRAVSIHSTFYLTIFSRQLCSDGSAFTPLIAQSS